MTMSNKYSAKHDQIKNDHDRVNRTIIEVTTSKHEHVKNDHVENDHVKQ